MMNYTRVRKVIVERKPKMCCDCDFLSIVEKDWPHVCWLTETDVKDTEIVNENCPLAEEGITIMIDKDGIGRGYDAAFDITIHCESKEDQDNAIKMLQKAERYKWHDLRQKPDDLPEKDYEAVEVWLKGNCIDIAIYCKTYGFRAWYAAHFEDCTPEWETENPVIAWRYIEVFEDPEP